MGLVKHLVPPTARDRIFEAVNNKLPEGFAHDHFANALSVGGATLVIAGGVLDYKGYRKTGTAIRAIGQVVDDLDGDTARRLGTDGELGANIDATLDKIKAFVEIGVLLSHTKEMPQNTANVRRASLGLIGVKHATNAGLNLFIKSKGGKAKSSNSGKANMWADGISMGSMGVFDSVGSETAKKWLGRTEQMSLIAGAVLGLNAARGYALQARDLYNNTSAV